MSDNREEFMRALEDTSSKYAEKTTRLSRLLTRLESLLVNLPGKIEASVTNDGDGVLRFCRGVDGWALEFNDVNDEGHSVHFVVTDAPVYVKVKAARLLPGLIETITTQQTRQLESVEQGLEAIEAIPWLDADSEVKIAIEEEVKIAEPWLRSSSEEVPF